MRRGHLEALRPVCPVCRPAEGGAHALRLAAVAREEDGHVVEGVLLCPNPACQREYPILDGVPLIIADLRQYVADQFPAIDAREDLGEMAEGLLGDCAGPNAPYNHTRQHLSSYTWDHYGDLDPQESGAAPAPGSMLRALRVALDLAGPPAAGPRLDAGCAVGRASFALAEGHGELVLGVDLNFALLRVAARALRRGVVRYPRRRTGLVHERREFAVRLEGAARVDFWACDATALPFAERTFALVAALNLLDCVAAPHAFLASAARVLRPGGRLAVACPYDWAAGATPVEAWLGGHSQRSPLQGASDAILRALLTPGAHPQSIPGLALLGERGRVPWHVRLHDRSVMTYDLHVVAAARA